ncbi:hypothetical protein DPMN_159597 [Dreissena polymorpha]|uniref:Uncharacterized protein n=1 Tax=Dreissena polymorpha TaxID=45954 RepID=A0A9D4EPG3_DREPO|nr:hypothetical protein DPMN_159597 [Dreissena polymorpha]
MNCVLNYAIANISSALSALIYSKFSVTKLQCDETSVNLTKTYLAIECDSCRPWIHTSCAVVSSEDYMIVQATNCTWSCPKCDSDKISSSFSSVLSELENRNQFLKFYL